MFVNVNLNGIMNNKIMMFQAELEKFVVNPTCSDHLSQEINFTSQYDKSTKKSDAKWKNKIVEDSSEENISKSSFENSCNTKKNKLKKRVAKKCEECHKILASQASYYVHIKKHSSNRPYKCTSCPASFTTKQYLIVHTRKHTGEKPFSCSACNKSFSQKSSLNTHMRQHTGEKPYQCEICHKRFAVKLYVKVHKERHFNSKYYHCDLCSQSFDGKESYSDHLHSHSIVNFDTICEYCNRTFNSVSKLEQHKYKIHDFLRL